MLASEDYTPYVAPPPEMDLEKAASPLGDVVIKVVGLTADSWKLGVVQFSRAEIDGFDFFRAQYRTLAQFQGEHLWPVQRNRIGGLSDAVQISVDVRHRVAKFGPKGNIIMRDKGLGIGSYLMAKTIQWAKTHYPDAKVMPGELSSVDARDAQHQQRRNQFYKKQGFQFKFYDGCEKISGHFFADRIDGLVGEWNHDKITELGADYLIEQLIEVKQLLEARDRDALSARGAAKRYEKHFLKWRQWTILISIAVIFLISFPRIPTALHRALVAAFRGFAS